MDEILYRVTPVNQLDSIFKYGFNRDFAGTNVACSYGYGVYTTHKLADSIRNLTKNSQYGGCIVKMRLIGGFKGFIIFNEDIAKRIYGQDWTIERQLMKVAGFTPEYAKSLIPRIIERAKLRGGGALYKGRTAPSALGLWHILGEDLYVKYHVRGVIYYGDNDGNCAVPYNFSEVIPLSVSFDGGKTFKPRDNSQVYEYFKSHTDELFMFGGKYLRVFKSVLGFTMVQATNKKYNVVENKTKKEISDTWFDMCSLVDHETGKFGFECSGIKFVGCIYTPKGGNEVGCILGPDTPDAQYVEGYNSPCCDFSDLKGQDGLISAIKQSDVGTFEEFYWKYIMADNGYDEETNESVRRGKIVIKESQLRRCILENVNKALNSLLFEEHLKVVNNINDIVKLVGDTWESPDDIWWIKIESRLKDHLGYNRRNNPQQKKWWSRVPGPDGTSRENHVGYVIVRGANKEACQRSILNAVVHLNPWAAKQCGVKSVYSNGNAEAIKLVCNYFFARSYITINKRSMNDTISVSRRDKKTGLFKGREFHHRAGQTRTGVDSSGVNWTVKRPLGLIDCDIDNDKAQAELDKYLSDNGVTPLFRKPSHDGMHYVISIKDAEGLDFSFLDKYATNNRPGDPNVLFKPDANLLVYSAVG